MENEDAEDIESTPIEPTTQRLPAPEGFRIKHDVVFKPIPNLVRGECSNAPQPMYYEDITLEESFKKANMSDEDIDKYHLEIESSPNLYPEDSMFRRPSFPYYGNKRPLKYVPAQILNVIIDYENSSKGLYACCTENRITPEKFSTLMQIYADVFDRMQIASRRNNFHVFHQMREDANDESKDVIETVTDKGVYRMPNNAAVGRSKLKVQLAQFILERTEPNFIPKQKTTSFNLDVKADIVLPKLSELSADNIPELLDATMEFLPGDK